MLLKINIPKFKEYYLTIFYIIYLIICFEDIDLHKENLIFTIFSSGFWSTDYKGSFIQRFRDLFIAYIFYVVVLIQQFIKINFISPKFVAFNVVLIFVIFFIGFLIGRFLISKTSKYHSVKQGFIIVLIFLFLVTIFRNVLIAKPIWLIFNFIFTVFFIQKDLGFYKIFLVTAPLFIIEFILFLFDSNIFIEVDVIYFISYLIGLFLAWKMKLTFHTKRTYYFISVAVLLISFVVVPLTQNIINQKNINSYSAISGVFEKPLIYNKDTISLNDFMGKVLVLDFWNSACRPCFEKFPQFEKFASKYKSNKDILFFAVNTPIEIEKEKNPEKIMDSLNYKFENLFLLDDSISKGLGIKYYPTILYIDKTQTKIIAGNIETNFWVFNNSIKIIDRFLKE